MIKLKPATGTSAKPAGNTRFSTSSITRPPTIRPPTMSRCLLSVAIASSLLLVGCGDDDNERVTGYSTTVESINSLSTSEIDSFGASIGAPAADCGVAVEKVSYATKGAGGENTNATAALMLPTGDVEECQGDRPILLYAHGTTLDKSYDLTQIGTSDNSANSEASLIAANFAAQGYIVVAPNYAGYDDSDLDYHPYLIEEQQSTDMADALDSAREIIARQQRANDSDYTNIDDSGTLFISGYSQGGHVAMATARKLQQEGKSVTAIAPSSGPYALAAFGDFIFRGNVNIGATRFAPLLAEGMQKKYGNIYTSPTDIFKAEYASTQLPNMLSFQQLVDANKLPEFALFERNPVNNPTLNQLPEIDSNSFSSIIGFADDKYLIKTDFRTAYVADELQNRDNLVAGTGVLPADSPQNNLRKALKDNDLRGYIPKMPTLLCGGNQDPTVYYDLNTGSMSAILQNIDMQNPSFMLNVTVLDVDTTNIEEDSREGKSVLSLIGQASTNRWDVDTVAENVQNSFKASRQFVISRAIQQGNSPANAVLADYHGALVSTACTQATREFFEQNFNQSANPT
ncbi:MAG: hypothetical protein J7J29_05775 [Psychrobacter sp.]|nr:hypothetical protein [Psychrobacter sp.]